MDKIMLNFILHLIQGFSDIVSDTDSPLFYLFVILILCGVVTVYRKLSH